MTPEGYGEGALVERPAMELLAALGWETVDARQEVLGDGGTLGRDSRRDVVMQHRLRRALQALNPSAQSASLEEAITAISRDRSALDPLRANREVWNLLRDGHLATWRDPQGREATERIAYLDWLNPDRNEWLAASQVWVAGELHTRRADVVCFVNGIPLVVMEMKGANRRVREAYDGNLRDYRSTVPQLFWSNGFVVLSNGSEARVGASHAPWELFDEWRTIDAMGGRGRVGLETAIRATCAKDRLLDLLENFVTFSERPGGLVKSLARGHQYFGVNAAIAALERIRETGEKKLGVFWHTQGSGKSLSMLWFTQKVLRRIPGKWTFVMVTDRKELDEQLHGEFADSGAINREAAVHADSSEHLRELLGADHRYVFTLIHKFRTLGDEAEMPVLSERDDVIVITDEAHRTQYDTLALNMRRALTNAAFMGFTGTPLLAGEELTRQEFGDYVSIYNFRDAIEDHATVPLYYDNRIPELQITNEHFTDELAEILDAADVDEDAEARLARRFGTLYQLITRPKRLQRIAEDLVRHFAGRGFPGKAMYVGIDKATAVRMHGLVQGERERYLAELRAERDRLPVIERAWVESQIDLLETTEMAVVVSQGQNEIDDLAKLGLDIRPHRARMVNERLDDRFKDPTDPLRLVFVCAMWMTGFDAPSCSTIYLDRPMRNHTLMQTIARANRVFPDKENGLIADYIGVFRDLQNALAIYGAATAESGVDSPIQDKAQLVAKLAEAVDACHDLCERYDIDLEEMRRSKGFDFIALRDSAVEALLFDDEVRQEFLGKAARARKLFKAVLPDPAAATHQQVVAVIRVIAERLADLGRGERPDITSVADAVDELLDRSVGAEEYLIRAAAEGLDPEPLIDLSEIDFDALAIKFAGRKRTETERLAALLRDRAISAARRNPTRHELVDRIEQLIADYNAGSLNIDELLRRLSAEAKGLSDEERRALDEQLTEDELAIFDLLTKPDPVLTDTERAQVKGAAKRLLTALHEALVTDWRRRAETLAGVRVAIGRVLDAELPAEPYPRAMYEGKVQSIFDHVVVAYGDDGTSVYDEVPTASTPGVTTAVIDVKTVAADIVAQLKGDAEFAATIAKQLLGGDAPTFLLTIDDLLAVDEDSAVEFKSTARWNLNEQHRDKEMEDAVVKTIAGFLNTRGGTLLIGVANDRSLVGLEHDYPHVKPQNADGLVNWLTTHLHNAVGARAMMRTKARVRVHKGVEICRVDVAPANRPVRAKTSKAAGVFFVRANNSTRALTEAEVDEYLLDRWPEG